MRSWRIAIHDNPDISCQPVDMTNLPHRMIQNDRLTSINNVGYGSRPFGPPTRTASSHSNPAQHRMFIPLVPHCPENSAPTRRSATTVPSEPRQQNR
jgi:hypothetical protein